MHYFNPLRWTALTWLAVCVWCWGAIPLNYPPSVSYELDSSGKLSNPTHYTDLSEYPFPVGWPFHYVEPDDPIQSMVPAVVGTPSPLPGPSSISILALFANSILVLSAIASLIVLLQAFIPRFSLRLILVLPFLYPVYFLGARVVGLIAGYNAVEWYVNGVYFSPTLVCLAIAFFRFPVSFPVAAPTHKIRSMFA